jgi:hypothetical protein
MKTKRAEHLHQVWLLHLKERPYLDRIEYVECVDSSVYIGWIRVLAH